MAGAKYTVAWQITTKDNDDLWIARYSLSLSMPGATWSGTVKDCVPLSAGFCTLATSLFTAMSAVMTLVAWYSAGRKLLLHNAGPTTMFGVGRSTTRTVVQSIAAILITDMVFVYLTTN